MDLTSLDETVRQSLVIGPCEVGKAGNSLVALAVEC